MSNIEDLAEHQRRGRRAKLRKTAVADVQAEAVRWLWPGRLALGKISMIYGDPGLGKSMLALDIAARVSRGLDWPDGSPCEAGDVLILSAEDDVADTIKPRLVAAGADVDRITCLDLVEDGPRLRTLSLATDLDALVAEIEELPRCRALLVDPVAAFMGDTDSHANADVRGVLAPLAEAAARLKVAVPLIGHLNKTTGQASALHRAGGSMAFVAAARAAWVVTKDKDDPDRRLFLPAKNNLAEDRTGLAYRIVPGRGGSPRLAWEPDLITDIAADEALAGSATSKAKPREEAAAWLQARLSNGPVEAKAIWGEAEGIGLAKRTVNRAKEQLSVETFKEAGRLDGAWFWQLPPAEGCQTGWETDGNRGRVPTVHIGESGTLRGSGTLRRMPLSEECQNFALGDDEAADQPEVDGKRWTDII
jgi:hypothetical protein